MSTILKALRRLEHDRSERSGRPLRQEVSGANEARHRPRRWPLLGAAVVCGLAVGPLALVVWTELLPKTGSPPTPVAAAQRVASEFVAPSPSPTIEALAAASSLPSEAVEAVPLPEPPAPFLPVEPVAEERVAEALPPPIISSEVEMLKRPAPEPRIAAAPDDVPAEPVGPRPGSVRPYPPPERTVAAVNPPVSTALSASTPSPNVATATPASVPAVRVESTEWHPSPQRRVAVVALEGSGGNPLRLQEGDVVGALVVGEIRPSAVTFYHDGIELLRRVGDKP